MVTLNTAEFKGRRMSYILRDIILFIHDRFNPAQAGGEKIFFDVIKYPRSQIAV